MLLLKTLLNQIIYCCYLFLFKPTFLTAISFLSIVTLAAIAGNIQKWVWVIPFWFYSLGEAMV